jgi:hypothetical protein
VEKAPAPKRGGTFLAGATSRLLPASVPFRFFGAAAAFHTLAWLALLMGAADWPQWRGGLGWPLAALHLITLGTLVASAIGASLQLLPVATRQPVRSSALAAALWWAYVPGVALLALGMGLARPGWLAVGAGAVILALVTYGVLLAMNLRGARGMPGVVLHGWGALAALALLAVSALLLVALWLGQPLVDRDTARALHLLGGVFGVMGLLAFGFAYILLPMFALASVPDERQQLASGATAIAAIGLASLAAVGVAPLALRIVAIIAGAVAFALHLRLVRNIFATGMRRDLGRALLLMRIGWSALALALALALAAVLADAYGGPAELFGRLFVIAAVGGWLLSFLFGVLERILPFLAAMHAAQGQKRPPTPSALTLERPLDGHFGCHVAALALLATATVAESPMLAALAAGVGAVGAVCFDVFYITLMRRLRQAGAAGAGQDARL